jgi:metallophosphoesterase superfamily enzyme
MSERKLILPAFGALTGGLDAAHPALLKAMQPARSITALVPTAARVAHFPLWQAAAA